MAAAEPAAEELSNPDAAVHEMFDNSVYREMHNNPSSQVRGSPSSRATSGMAQPFSWMETPVETISPDNKPS